MSIILLLIAAAVVVQQCMIPHEPSGDDESKCILSVHGGCSKLNRERCSLGSQMPRHQISDAQYDPSRKMVIEETNGLG